MQSRIIPPQRVIMRIELLPQARDGLAEHCERLGMTQVATTSRLVDWFCQQDDVIQAGVLGIYPENIRAELPVLVLKRLASQKKKSALL
jgi:hypothetical protein